MSYKSAFILAAALSCFGASAFAQCDEAQETSVGKTVAARASAAVSKAVAVEGKQMVNLSTCEAVGGGYTADFKYNFLGAGGLYWAEGTVKISKAGEVDLRLRRLSPNLSEASAKSGVKLAAN